MPLILAPSDYNRWLNNEPDPRLVHARRYRPDAHWLGGIWPHQVTGIGGLWENWKDPSSGEWLRTFAVITTDANELVAEIHCLAFGIDRLAPGSVHQ